MDVEICVFPQEGLTNNPGTEDLMREALAQGARVVGAAPYTDPDPRTQIDRVFALAREFDVDIDMHLDLGDSPAHMDAEYVCELTERIRYGGRVTIGRVTNVLNPFTPFGDCSLVRMANLYANVCHVGTPAACARRSTW